MNFRRRLRGRTCSAIRSRRIGEANNFATDYLSTHEGEVPNGFSRMDCSNAVRSSLDLYGGGSRCLVCFLLYVVGSRIGERGNESVIGVELSFEGGTRCSVAENPCGKSDLREDTFRGARYAVRLIHLHPRVHIAAFWRGSNMQTQISRSPYQLKAPRDCRPSYRNPGNGCSGDHLANQGKQWL